MLEHISLDELYEIQRLAAARREAEGTESREVYQGVSVDELVLTDEHIRLRRFLEALGLEKRQELTAVMYLARGDAETLEDALRYTGERDPHPDYLAGKPLDKYIQEGLQKAGLV